MKIDYEIRILDFGCGAGWTVYWFLDEGFKNVAGFDIEDRLQLRDPADRALFRISESGSRLPFDDDCFDLIVSENVIEHVQDQAAVFRELLRVMRPGGHGLHVFPARYCPVETHFFVPFGGIFAHRWYYKLWALAGVRKKSQRLLNPDEVADENAAFFVSALNYVPNSCYQVLWKQIGFDFKWVERELFSINQSWMVQILKKIDFTFPMIAWLYRTFRSRWVYLTKPVP